VLQDIEDFILMQGFKGHKPSEVEKTIQEDLQQRRRIQKDRTKEAEEQDKEQDRKRTFLNSYLRPPYCWNFFEPEEETTQHVLRPTANPMECYRDKRIESIMEDIDQLGLNLKNHEDVNWKQLLDYVIKIFLAEYKEEQEYVKEWESKE